MPLLLQKTFTLSCPSPSPCQLVVILPLCRKVRIFQTTSACISTWRFAMPMVWARWRLWAGDCGISKVAAFVRDASHDRCECLTKHLACWDLSELGSAGQSRAFLLLLHFTYQRVEELKWSLFVRKENVWCDAGNFVYSSIWGELCIIRNFLIWYSGFVYQHKIFSLSICTCNLSFVEIQEFLAKTSGRENTLTLLLRWHKCGSGTCWGEKWLPANGKAANSTWHSHLLFLGSQTRVDPDIYAVCQYHISMCYQSLPGLGLDHGLFALGTQSLHISCTHF